MADLSGEEPHLCKNELCKAPIAEWCQCEDCRKLTGVERKHRVFCHACTSMYVVVANSSHLQREHTKWKQSRDERRRNMGL